MYFCYWKHWKLILCWDSYVKYSLVSGMLSSVTWLLYLSAVVSEPHLGHSCMYVQKVTISLCNIYLTAQSGKKWRPLMWQMTRTDFEIRNQTKSCVKNVINHCKHSTSFHIILWSFYDDRETTKKRIYICYLKKEQLESSKCEVEFFLINNSTHNFIECWNIYLFCLFTWFYFICFQLKMISSNWHQTCLVSLLVQSKGTYWMISERSLAFKHRFLKK